ncbi:MAG: sel1 repeat family protein [Alphaproteobacteria bacterium]|nr:sel1 repeat family protein [Alphaproteobacteria bacterium]
MASVTAKLEPSKDAAPTPVAPESASPAAPTSAANGPAPTAPAEPRISAAEAAELLSRGDTAFGVGDIASARLFYERAADAGSGEAALRLGETYDPNFLERAKLRSVQGDPKAAIHWYWRAKELGIAEADILLKGMQTK